MWVMLTSVAIFATCGGCLAAESPAVTPAGPEWAHNLPVYETWLDLSTPTDKFSEFEGRLDALKDMGVGIIWFVPIFPTDVKKDAKLDHPYTVEDFLDVNPRHGSKEDFKHLVDAIHAHGMYVMMDFVPHHTAWENPLIKAHPEFYKTDKEGKIETASKNWKGAALLDYSNRDLWEYMFQAHKFWMTKYDVDAFREDQAGLVPQKFWNWLRPKLNEIKPVFMLAEADKGAMHPAFDMTYDWTSHAYFAMIAKGTWQANSLDKMLEEEEKTFPPDAVRMRHLSNHDMERSQYSYASLSHVPESEHEWMKTTPLQDKYSGGQNAFFVLCSTLPRSKPMVWNGQEQNILGNTPRLTWDDKTPYFGFYKTILHAYRENPALYEGDFKKIDSSNADTVYAFGRRAGGNKVVVVVNLSGNAGHVKVKLGSFAGRYEEIFGADKQELKGDEELDLPAWGYKVFVSGTPKK
jgi:glycosidase